MFAIAIAVLLAADPAENPWETQRTEPILIKTRARAGTGVKEIWAEGTIDAAPIDIQDALTDVKRMPEFMPYMTESRFVGGSDADGAQYTYQRVSPLLLSRSISTPRPGPSSATTTGSGRPIRFHISAHHKPISSPKIWLISGAVVKSPCLPIGARVA